MWKHSVVMMLVTFLLLIFKSSALPLDDVMNQQEPNFKWTVVFNETLSNRATLVLNMTSVQYLTTEYVDRVIWNHQVYIYAGIPNIASHALLFIDGGSNGDEIRTSTDFTAIAEAVKCTVVVVKQVPNQPLVFKNDTRVSRYEDDILAWGWRKFMDSPSPKDFRFLGHLYMAKASSLAMTAASQAISQSGIRVSLDKWVVAGGSKRGWATWLVAAGDVRVTHFIPIVIEILNMRKTLSNTIAADCQLPPAMEAYVNENFESYFNTTKFDELANIVDPIVYNSRYVSKPKMIISASRDEFFGVSNGLQFYDDVLGDKRLRVVPNVGHSLSGSDVYDTLFSYYALILSNIPAPTLSWNATTINNSTTLSGSFSSGFSLVSLVKWEAYNPVDRNFRPGTSATSYLSTNVNYDGSNQWSVTVEHPTTGYKAFFVEATFAITPIGKNFKTTTLMYVVPDTYPCTHLVPIVAPVAPSSSTPRPQTTSPPPPTPVASSALLQTSMMTIFMIILSVLLF